MCPCGTDFEYVKYAGAEDVCDACHYQEADPVLKWLICRRKENV